MKTSIKTLHMHISIVITTFIQSPKVIYSALSTSLP